MMIDELKGFHYLVLMSGIRQVQALVEVCDIDCEISTVRRDSRSFLLRFLHFAGCPTNQYLENKVSLPISWTFKLNSLSAFYHHKDREKASHTVYHYKETISVL